MKKIIIDANLLVLLVVGLTKPDLIGRHKRTKSFEIADFELLTKALSNFEQIIVTPHILTEASNLISQIAEPAASTLRNTLSELLSTQQEEFEPSSEITTHSFFLRLGLTDCAILRIVEKEVPVITTDLDLYLAAAKSNPNAINFTYLRQERLVGI